MLSAKVAQSYHGRRGRRVCRFMLEHVLNSADQINVYYITTTSVHAGPS